MAVPKRRTSHARQGNRRSHHHKKPIAFAYCARCGETVKPHIVCWHCGWSSVQNRELVQIDAPAEE